MSDKVAGIDFIRCITCGSCAGLCPQEAIYFDNAGYAYKVDPERCVGCGTCLGVCSARATYLEDRK